MLDDLERLGFISRRPDPQIDAPSDRGVAFTHASDSIIGEIEARHAARIGAPAYARVKHHLQSITSQEPEEQTCPAR